MAEILLYFTYPDKVNTVQSKPRPEYSTIVPYLPKSRPEAVKMVDAHIRELIKYEHSRLNSIMSDWTRLVDNHVICYKSHYLNNKIFSDGGKPISPGNFTHLEEYIHLHYLAFYAWDTSLIGSEEFTNLQTFKELYKHYSYILDYLVEAAWG